jgi:hypothetical protein
LKPNRGNGGIGVLKVENASYGTVRAQEAGGDAAIRVLPLSDFLVQMRDAFSVEDGLLDQPYQVRLTDGMIRCYVSGQSVAGFGHQMVRALASPAPGIKRVHPDQTASSSRSRRPNASAWPSS